MFGAIAFVVWLIAILSIQWLPWSPHPRDNSFPGEPWFESWVHWDAGWYYSIAETGYFYTPGSTADKQSSVAFFPAYPLAMRAGALVAGDSLRAGIFITLAAGASVAVLFWTWLRERLRGPPAWTALALLLVFPWAYYLYGVVYADALFAAAILASFVLLEKRHPWLAGAAGAVASAARPVGIVVIIGLVIRALEINGVFDDGWRHPKWPAAVKALRHDGGVLLSAAGLGGYCLYLWSRFGNPFVFAEAEKAWGQGAGPHSWFKIEFFNNVTNFGGGLSWVAYMSHPVVTLTALALVPFVFRRFGLGYGIYSLLIIGLAAFSTKDFFGMARYALAAFPVFAVAGEMLADHPRVRAAALSVSALGLVILSSMFARGTYLS
ncbi:MAG: hypothetical protein M3Z84_08315 [Actinomycetota bacterium]|nr:hypothetical protein [Actinomycetota bacterium]